VKRNIEINPTTHTGCGILNLNRLKMFVQRANDNKVLNVFDARTLQPYDDSFIAIFSDGNQYLVEINLDDFLKLSDNGNFISHVNWVRMHECEYQ
jgi:hypothetical protein